MIPARLYGPGLPVAGERVQVLLDGGHLKVLQAPERRPALSQVSVSVGGFDHDELFLTWEDPDGRWTVHPEGAAGREAFMKEAPETLKASLRQWRRHTGAQTWVLRGVAACAALLVLSAGLLWWKYDAALGWVASHVSPQTELQLGEAALKSLQGEGDLVDKGPAVEAMKQIGGKLTQGSVYKYRWLVSADKQVNAFALPGGIVVVNRGLLEATRSADELAAVLAHEVQHVEQRHSLKGMLNSVGIAAVLMVVLGDASAMITVMAHQAGAMAFGRDLESRADLDGVRVMQQAGIPGQGMVQMLTRLKEASPGEGPGWLSSHPETQARIEAVQAWVQLNPCGGCRALAVDWGKVQVSVKGLVTGG